MFRKRKHAFFSLFFLLFYITGFAQTGPIKGKVTGDDGLPIPGATVVLKEHKNKGTMTKEDGTFSFNAGSNSAVLEISALGYNSQEITAANTGEVAITLKRDTRALDMIVVTALGVKRDKRNLTFSSQEVKAEELTRAKDPSVLNALTGKVSGVQITSTSGTPGSSSRIVIRGATSILGNNEALIVMDGVPIDNTETNVSPGGGGGTSRLSDIDPAIIESINVLKGAAATALYGSAGARGVVMITTKKGSANKKPQLTFSSDLGWDYAILPERQTKYTLGTGGKYSDGVTSKASGSWGARIDTLRVNGQPIKTHNLMKEFYKPGITTNNGLSVAGGTAKSGYLLSYSYFDQSGIVPKDKYKRHNLFAKFNTAITDNLQMTFQMGYTNAEKSSLPEGYGLSSPLLVLYAAPISYDLNPYVEADGITQRLYRFKRNNPYWIANNILNHTNVNRFMPVINLSYTPTNWLTVTERAGADIYTAQQDYHVNIGDISFISGYIQNDQNNSRIFNNDLMVQARKSFNKFNTSLLVGNNIYSNYNQTSTTKGQGLSIPGYYNMGNASTVSNKEYYTQQRKIGFYAQADIEYNRFLVLALSGRLDGSSVLSTDHLYYPYGSAALGFVFSELMPASWKEKVDFAKLRVSYAMVGNDNVSPYSNNTPYKQASGDNVIPGYMSGLSFPYNGQNGFLISQTLGNKFLKNERMKEFETGLEARFFGNRLGFEASYFHRKMSDGLIAGAQISAATGYTGTTLNSAEMETKGIEALVNITPVKTKNFSWDVTANYSRLRNKVTRVAPDLPTTNIGFTYAIEGQPYGAFFTNKFARTADGQLKIDANGMPYADDASGVVGNVNPNWTGGLTNTFRYKQLVFSFFLDTKQGGNIYNQDEQYGYVYGTAKITENRDQPLIIKGISDVTGKPNTVAVNPQSYYGAMYNIGENFVQDGSYIKLRNVSLSYNFGHSLLAHTPIKDASLTVTGKNLWIYKPHFTGPDPEVNSFGSTNGSLGMYAYSTPTTRSILFSLKVVF
ncbi:TonB-linked SusC/RagA family outer membrane protein [Chitinophaga niastensis]|uniref:TonB-linked SusC/RagA family outer membrane protein n=1 Tax=Chitinophaga niastensis TaxID=536980 RepID=A0A2P8HIR0_CHINA|nr:SusC/RagA family TonB-linked outer membrane protein [Chitinophaga niastensis]PSL46109.1 TonB-linked SusC/RagA family outer membrane protein [Chitinophaga niastensis]